MAWPFTRRRDEAAKPSLDKPLQSKDKAVYEALGEWLSREDPSLEGRITDHGAYRVERPDEGRLLLVAQARGGKLVRVEVHDGALRPLVDRLVKAFESEGLWSFNGVVRTAAGDP